MEAEPESAGWTAISRTKDRLSDARFLIQAARDHGNEAGASIFCGCACMILVIALEEETSLIIRAAIEQCRRQAGSGAAATLLGVAALSGATLPKRILALPKLMSEGRLAVRPTGLRVRALWELLRVRRALAHETPSAVIELGPEADSSWEGELIAVLRDDPWRRVSQGAAESYLEAARCFIEELQEIDLDDDGCFQGGEITGPTST